MKRVVDEFEMDLLYLLHTLFLVSQIGQMRTASLREEIILSINFQRILSGLKVLQAI